MVTREELHRLVDTLSEADWQAVHEAEAAIARSEIVGIDELKAELDL